ncbi:LacI family DNA-binding transcriptional regulator [Lactiplantibacillus plantarum]|nr:LacI family DNA-binding transcriptional regulator [Lactiplantibacillus plantarum]
MTTIRDIAKLSGYSIATVSRVLNQHGYVSDNARLEIERVVKQADYVPNAVAQDLSIGNTHDIGVVLPHASHPYFTQLIRGIMSTAFASDYRITLLPSEYNEMLEIKYLEQLRRKLFDGIIFTSHGISLKQLSSYLTYGPIVICEDPGTNNIPAVFSKRESSYNDAFSWLWNNGVKRIAFLFSRSPDESATSSVTLKSFEQVYHYRPNSEWIVNNVTTFSDGYTAAKHLYTSNLDIEYIFANGDDVAAGVRQYYIDHKLTFPKLIGQENQVSGFLLNIPTIDHHLTEIGKEALKLVISDPEDNTTIMVESEFVTGNKRTYRE